MFNKNLFSSVFLVVALSAVLLGCAAREDAAAHKAEAAAASPAVSQAALAAEDVTPEAGSDDGPDNGAGTADPSVTATPTLTSTPKPTATPKPTSTPTPTPTPTPEADPLAGTIESQNVGLTPDMTYAEFSAINSDSAILYTNHYENANGITVCVNAGHGTSGGGSVRTQCHPDGTPKVTGGTNAEGATTAMAVTSGMTFADGTEERAVTLAEALILRDMLFDAGYNVLMIREGEDIQLDNIARTVLANTYADCHIALHWDSTDWDKGCYYMSVPRIDSYMSMEPVASTWQKSEAFGDCLINGLRNAGNKIFESGSMPMDLTQTSYSSIPSVDIELGDHTSDHSEETLKKLAAGLLEGVNLYFKSAP